jgi:uncharacterized protein YaiL (DUF2058 family)
MSESLRDQLLKAGLGKKLKDEAKAAPLKPSPPRPHHNKPAHQHGKPMHPPKPTKPAQDVDLARAYAQRAQVEREERERAQREAERVARERKERKQKLTMLLAGKALNSDQADVPRHFPHGNKIRRIYCTKGQLEKLNRGDLAVVQLAGRYLLVEREIAAQAQAIQAESLVLLCDPNAPAEDDVPADLVW